MTNFQFNDEQNSLKNANRAKKVGGLKGMFINLGVAKDEKQADIVLWILFIVVVGLIIYVNFLR